MCVSFRTRAVGLIRREPRCGSERLGVELCSDELGDDAWVGLPARLLHYLTDEEPEEAVLPTAVGFHLPGIRLEDARDDRLQLRLVGDRLLREVRVGGEAGLAELRDRLVEHTAGDEVARLDEPRELLP